MAAEKPFLQAIGFTKATGMYEIVFPFFLIWGFSFAILQKTQALSESKDLNAFLAFFIAMSVIFFPTARAYIIRMVPYITVYILAIFLIALAYMAVGAGTEDIRKALQDERAYIILLVLLVIIFFIPLAQVLGPTVSPGRGGGNATTGGGGFGLEPGEVTLQDIYNMKMGERLRYFLASPPVVGMIVMLSVFAVSIYALLKD